MYVNYNKVTTLTENDIADMLMSDDAFLERSILVLHKRQRALEQQTRETFYKNDEGFQVADSRMFSSFSEIIRAKLANNVALGSCLTEEQKRYVRRPWHRPRVAIATICKYRKQILEEIENAVRVKRAQ